MLFLPDQHLGRNTAVLRAGPRPSTTACVRPAQAGRRADRRAAARREDDPVAGPLLGARPVHAWTASTRCATAIPDVNMLVHPECRHEVVEAADWSDRPSDHPHARRGAGRVGVGRRHRAQPGPPPGRPASGQADRVPRPDGLLLLDDEPHRPAAPRVVAGIARARARSSTGSPSSETVAANARVALDRMLALP